MTEATGFEGAWSPPRHWLAAALAPVNNRILGTRFMVTAFLFFLAGGLMAVLMRTQLAVPENDFLDPKLYNQLFTMHGSTMMFLFVVPFLEGLAIFFVPAMIGSRDVAYPRLTAFGYWIYLFGGLIFFASFFVGAVPDSGWFSYTPLSGKEFSPGIAQDFWLLGLSLTELSGMTAGAELVVTILKLRAPGMSLTRMPIFVWALLVTAFAMVFAFTTLFVATLLLELERGAGFHFFDPANGGSPLLWQHLFWIFGHPEVYIMFIPATGIVSTIVATFARRPLALYRLIVLALLVTGFVSFGLWVHHMFTTGMPELAASFFTGTSFMIALATGTQIFAWIATLWGMKPRLATPMLYVLGFIVIFMIGGVTGVMIASVPFDWQAHDSFFIVAHFHYVLIGGVVFPILGALHYWLPNITGRLLHERFGVLTFWVIFVAFNLTFFPMHLSGLAGMPRRVYSYQEGSGLYGYNLLSTLGSYLLAAGFLMFVFNVIWSLRKGALAGGNPWGAGTVEWIGGSPAPSYGFRRPPVVHGAYPLWEVEKRREPDEEVLQRAADGLDGAPQGWRATLVTSALGGEPRGVLYLPGPTFVPFLTAVAVSLAAVGALVKLPWLAAAGLALTVVMLAIWLWPNRNHREKARLSDRLLAARGEPPLPGGGEVGSMGAAFFALIVGTIAAVLLFSYFYLVGVGGPAEPPEWRLPAAGLALLLLAAALVGWAGRSIRSGRSAASRWLFGAALILGLGYLALQATFLLRLDFLPQENAYASAFYTLAGFVLLAVAVAASLLAASLLRLGRGLLEEGWSTPLANVVLYWSLAVALALVSFAVLILIPSL